MLKSLSCYLTIYLIILSFFQTNTLSEDNKLDKNNLTLGVIVPLSGPLAFFGNDYVRAFDLATSARPDIKSKIKIAWEDSAYDSKKAIQAFNKLTTVDKADLVISFGGPMLNVLAPIAENQKIPFFATESAKSDCENKTFCTLLRNEEDEWGLATWKMLRQENKKNIGIIKNQNQFMNTFVDAIRATKNSDESVDILIDVPPEETDLRSQVLKIRSKHYDALGIYLLPPSHIGLLKASSLLKNNNFLFGVEEFLVKEHNAGFETFTNGARVVAPWTTDEYRKTFENKYGYSAGFFYTPAFYDFLNLLTDTFNNNGKISGEELVKALRFSGEREGVSGKYKVKISEKGVYSISFPIAVYKFHKGETSVEEIYNF